MEFSPSGTPILAHRRLYFFTPETQQSSADFSGTLLFNQQRPVRLSSAAFTQVHDLH
jgi:hypothetical protein